MDPGTDNLRIVIDTPFSSAVRNRSATFLNTQLALDATLSYNAIPAISGHIETLETFTPTPDAKATPSPDPGAYITGGVMAGRILHKVTPTYPFNAKINHIHGTVLLHAIIGTDGIIHSLSPIASPDKSLTDAAMDAVKHWTYTPYLLNGQPTDVDTTITVNFNLYGG